MRTYTQFLESQLLEGFNHIVMAQRARIEADSRTPGTSGHFLSLAKQSNALRLHHESLSSFHSKSNNIAESGVHANRANEYAKNASLNLAQYHQTKAKELVNDDIEGSIKHQMKGEEEMNKYRNLQ